jgi:outer membrane protein assembly factor BamB
VPKHAAPVRWGRRIVPSLLVLLLVGVAAVFLSHRESRVVSSALPPSTVATVPVTTTSPSTTTTLAATGFPSVPGLLTFRGNLTRTYYGEGPVPMHPKVLWSYPDKPMCSQSHDVDGFAEWCGMGWTGEPAVWERDGKTLLAFGAYDRAVHVLDAADGSEVLPPFVTGDLIKGSVTIDPDGYPLLYTGSRDDNFRVFAFDRPQLTELWKLNAYDVHPTKWNNDWDGSALVVDDYLFEGGENSQFHIVKLNRSTDADGHVQVDPELVFHTPGWDDQLLRDVGDDHVSIESSVAIFDDVVYFANSGGLVEGWDVHGLADGDEPTRVFRYWTGDDTDASVVIDEEGMLYVASEYERGTARSKEVGQIMKLDPHRLDDPLVWSIQDRDTTPAGVWATPAIDRDMVYVPTNGGRLLGIDRATGTVRWTKHLPGPTWQSPVVVDDVLIQSDCSGVVHAYDVADTTVDPPELWRLQLPAGCIEATPAVWKSVIYLGTRSGYFLAIGDG